MKSGILKVKDWLKFKKPDYDGFVEHIKTWDREGIPYSLSVLEILAENYGISKSELHPKFLLNWPKVKKLLQNKFNF